MTERPFVVDLTYVVARLHAAAPTGIERVDATFARHFVGEPGRAAAGLHYGVLRPHVLPPRLAARLVREAGAAWQGDGPAADPVYQAVADWLAGPARPSGAARARKQVAPLPTRLAHRVDRTRWRLAGHGRVPADALYLNVAQYGFEYAFPFRWLESRPDVKPVFYIHDMLPLDYPEYFRTGYEAIFERRVRTMVRHAAAAIVSSETVAERIEQEMRRRGRTGLPVLAAPLPPTTAGLASPATQALGTAPYFVALGTVEPRKNHLLLLNLWRDLATGPGPVPRLVLVGARGWDNEQAVDMLERCRAIAPHILEVSGLGTPGLQALLGGARALLAPSFDEGYGLPVAEALAAGTPVICSDIPVFREISQGQALRLEPTDGPAWRRAVADMTPDTSAWRDTWVKAAARYRPPAWPAYFDRVSAFLATL